MSDQKLSMFDPHVLREIILRNKTVLVRGPLIALALGALVFLFAPRTYRSESRIFLRLGRESVGLDPTATTGQTLALQQADRKDEVKSAIEVLNSQSIIGQAVDKVGAPVVLGRDSKRFSLIRIVTAPLRWIVSLVKSIDPISEREEAIILVRRHLYVSAERDSNVISVQYDAKSPKLAQTVCDAIIDAYQHEHIRIHRSEESRPFFTEQQERLRTELDYALERVRSVKNEMGLSTIEQRRNSLEAQFNAVELDRLSTEEQLATAQARVADLEKRITETPERLIGSKKSIPNQGADLLRQQLYALQVKVMELKARFKETHPLVKAAEEQLAEAKQVIAKQATERTETTDNINTIYRDLSLELKRDQSQVAGLKARITELSKQKQAVLVALRAVNDEDVKLDQLNRQADLARGRFMKYSQSMEEARIDKALEADRISNVSIVQAATLADKPVSPSKPLIVIATLLLAIAGPIAFVLGSERLHTWLHPVDVANNGSQTPGVGGTNGTRRRQRVASRRLSAHPQTLSHTQPPA
jgi:uncharacterized protein involved in exopolysaccharide biosynthesis